MNISQPWFDAIISGKKTYEARVYTEFFKNLSVGSHFQITDGVKTQNVEVEQLLHFNNFGDAWFILQEQLIPSYIENIVVQEDAIKMYNTFYTQEDICQNGVVAIKINLV